ncbi:aldehyde dehydrogenase family protein [Burkholderia guangdongensis]|uniref:aldehyde dehydrogenase family protein n=1 Tax=Burkholderia guangdongensis TaxID=1792500 RepID=UPI0015CA78FE|nr:aldehyde dehydrogenase family protein [Burkholderia guangdongensis]
MIEAYNWINGEQTGIPDTPSFDPSNGEQIGRFAAGGLIEAAAAVAAARCAFDRTTWPHDARHRQRILLDWADALERDIEDLAQLLTRENGKPLQQARGEMAGAISEIRYYAGLTRHIPGHVLEPEPGVFSTILREPAGTVGIIVPWNAPAVLLVRSAAPALAAGCTVVIKPAAQTALFLCRLLDSLTRLAIAPGVVNVVAESDHEVAEYLVRSPDIDVLSFTGSTATGKKIMAAAAESVKKLSLELGGKSCCVVFEDADVQSIAPRLAQAATIISGQQCTAARRVLVHASLAPQMRESLRAALGAMRLGNGLAPDTQIGPLIDRSARDAVARMVEEACEQADSVLLRGGIPDGNLRHGSFLSPTLVEHDDPNAFFCQEEIFGPFVTLETFETEAEAVAKANNAIFGLSASVWTHDGARSMRVARALRNGTVWVNDHNKLFAEAETGGYRQSGLGRLHGYEALADFTELKHICVTAGVTLPG